MLTTADFPKICRACKHEKSNLLNLFASDSQEEYTLGDIFMCCTSINLVEMDNYPQNICYPCAKQLEATFKFLEMCRGTDKELRAIVGENFLKTDKTAKDNQPNNKENTAGSANNYCFPKNVILNEVLKEENFEESYEEELVLNSEERLNFIETESISDRDQNLYINNRNNVPSVESFTVEFEDSACDSVSVDSLNVDTVGQSIQPEISVSENIEISRSSGKYHFCDQCDKRFFTSRALYMHTKLHHKRKIINKSVESNIEKIEKLQSLPSSSGYMEKSTDYTTVMLLSNSINYDCVDGVSDDHSGQLSGTMQHPILIEAKQTIYECTICEKIFNDENDLLEHSKIHRVLIYKCPEISCPNLFFAEKTSFSEHLKQTHNKILVSDVKNTRRRSSSKTRNVI